MFCMNRVVLITFFVFAVLGTAIKPSRPHIVLFVIDDVGWTDLGFRNGSGMVTPFFDQMAQTGILLNKYYVQPVCSPSRAAFMQGRFPHHTGLQHYSTIAPASKAAMPLNQPTIAETLLQAGYRTHAVGKWHMGYCHWDNTPTGRGFETHKGYFQGEIDYFTKDFKIPSKFLPFFNVTGYDWWTNVSSTPKDSGIHNKYLIDEEALRVLNNYSPNKANPLFLYYAHQLAHVPIQSPGPRFDALCTHIQDPTRRVYCSMMAALDDSLKIVVNELQRKQMWDNTLLIVTTDNGGIPNVPGVFPASSGVNYPLRAGKGTVFEGGVRAFGFVQGGSNVIPPSSRGTQVDSLLHAVDWFPTIVNLAGQGLLPPNLDGLDQWDVLVNGRSNSRTSLPLNLNYHIEFPNRGHQVALISGDWKLIYESISGPVLNYDGWYPPPPAKAIPPPTNPTPGKFLFNLTADPNEYNNVFSDNPQVVKEIEVILKNYMKTYMEPQWNFPHLEGFPELNGGLWAPWLD